MCHTSLTNIPEVVGAIFVGNNDNGNFGVGFGGEHAVRSVGEVFLDIGADTFKGRFPERGQHYPSDV